MRAMMPTLAACARGKTFSAGSWAKRLYSSWIVSEKMLKTRPQQVQKTLNALYGAVVWLRTPANRDAAVKMIAEIDEIPPDIAAAELDGNISKLSAASEIKREWMVRALEMAVLTGMTNLAPVDDTFVR